MRTIRKAKTAEEFDQRFDAGEDIFRWRWLLQQLKPRTSRRRDVSNHLPSVSTPAATFTRNPEFRKISTTYQPFPAAPQRKRWGESDILC